MTGRGRGSWALAGLGAAGAALVLALTHGGRVLAEAARDLAAGRPGDAVVALEGRRGGDATEALVLGTALLDVGREADAVPELERAAAAPGGEARWQALHNLSVAHLRLALRTPSGRAVHARRAAGAAARALDLRPGEAGTERNLELALRLLAAEAEPPRGGAGDGAAAGASGPGDPGAPGGGPMERSAALRVLDGLRSEEGPALARGAARLFGGGFSNSIVRGPPW